MALEPAVSGHGGNRWELADALGIGPEAVVDFSADLNPAGPPPGWEQVAARWLPHLAWYPDPAYRTLREGLSRLYGLDPACLLPGNGSAELMDLVSRQLGCRTAGVVVPTFTEYERALGREEVRVLPWRLQEAERFSPRYPDPTFSLSAVEAIFLCHPNNPTGRLWPRALLLELAGACEAAGVTLVVDEATLDLVEDPPAHTMLPEVNRFRHLMVLRSLTKAFALPGLRLGCLAASPKTVDSIAGTQPPWSVNGLAASLGPYLSDQADYLDRSRAQVRVLRVCLEQALRSRVPDLALLPSAANFLLCRIQREDRSSSALAQALRRQGILIRCCDDFTGLTPGRYIRLAVRPQAEQDRLVTALEEFFAR